MVDARSISVNAAMKLSRLVISHHPRERGHAPREALCAPDEHGQHHDRTQAPRERVAQDHYDSGRAASGTLAPLGNDRINMSSSRESTNLARLLR